MKEEREFINKIQKAENGFNSIENFCKYILHFAIRLLKKLPDRKVFTDFGSTSYPYDYGESVNIQNDGKIVVAGQDGFAMLTINLNNHPKGMYFVEIVSDRERIVEKIVLEENKRTIMTGQLINRDYLFYIVNLLQAIVLAVHFFCCCL